MIIESGTGNGKLVGVSRSNRILADALSVTAEHYYNHENGEAYNVLFSQSPTAGDDCIFYMKNTSEKDLVVEGITLGVINAGAVDAEFYIKLNDKGTRNSATTVDPANLNTASGKEAEGDFEYGADLDGGAATLTGGYEIERYVLANVQDLVSTHLNFHQDVIIKPGGTLTLWASDAGATYYVTIPFHYHPAEEEN